MLKVSGIIVFMGLLVLTTHFQLSPDCFESLVPNTNCIWYVQCLEQKFQCGLQGYPLAYGFVYCQRFGRLKSFPAVRAWVDTTTICLKEKLLPFLNGEDKVSCQKLKHIAFETHPVCYEYGGFCELFRQLGMKDSLIFLKQILSIYKFKDFQSIPAIVQVFELGKKCLRKWI